MSAHGLSRRQHSGPLEDKDSWIRNEEVISSNLTGAPWRQRTATFAGLSTTAGSGLALKFREQVGQGGVAKLLRLEHITGKIIISNQKTN